MKRVVIHSSKEGETRRVWFRRASDYEAFLYYEHTRNRRTKFFHSYVEIGTGDAYRDVMISVAIPWFFAFWISLKGVLPDKWIPTRSYRGVGEVPESRKIGVSIGDGRIHFSVWENPMSWSRTDPKWWQFSWSYADFFLGKWQYHSETGETKRVLIPMPEGTYPALATYETRKFGRRFGKKKQLNGWNIEVEGGIPYMGKGENSWDCGPNGLWSTTIMVEDLGEAVGRFAGIVLKYRLKYGCVKPEHEFITKEVL